MPTNSASDCLRLPEQDEVHVWTALLSEALAYLPSYEVLLSIEERERAARFLRSEDRSRYVVAHGILRQMLGRYLALAPSALAFVTNAFGKPFLAGSVGTHSLAFNLAHSGDVIAFAVAVGRRIGVDVELVRTDLDMMEIAKGQFSPEEIGQLRALDPSERTAAFFRCWTRKEAYVKSRGEGLAFPLTQFSVSFAHAEPAGVRWVLDDGVAAQRWSMFELVPACGYAGAVVVEGQPATLIVRPWPCAG